MTQVINDEFMRNAVLNKLPVKTRCGDKRWVVADLRELGDVYRGEYPYLLTGGVVSSDIKSYTLTGRCDENHTNANDHD